MNLKKVLKTIKLHEREISVTAGILILFVAGIFIIRYIKNIQTETQNQQTTTPEKQLKTHEVMKGETLWSISNKYYKSGSEWKKIADANNILEPSKLEVGTNLIIPEEVSPPSVTPVPQISEKAASTTSTSEITGDSYTVVKGDYLWEIAMRAYGDPYKWVDIAKANNLHNPNLIHSGNVFKIPR